MILIADISIDSPSDRHRLTARGAADHMVYRVSIVLHYYFTYLESHDTRQTTHILQIYGHREYQATSYASRH